MSTGSRILIADATLVDVAFQVAIDKGKGKDGLHPANVIGGPSLRRQQLGVSTGSPPSTTTASHHVQEGVSRLQ